MRSFRMILILALLSLSALGQNSPGLNDELIAAARKSNVEAVKSLLAKGADPNAKTQYGATPIFFACDRGNAEIVKLLLDAGADPNVQDTFYKSNPLSWAIQRDHAEVVKVLVEKNPKSKEMAMGMAASEGQVKVAKALLDLGGFNPESLTTYLTNAERNKHTEVVELLKKAGAKPKPKVEYKVDAEALKMYEGVYKNEQIEFTFKIKDGQLSGGPSGQDLKLVPVEKHTFELEEFAGITLLFAVEGDKVVSLTVKRTDGQTVLKKVEVK